MWAVYFSWVRNANATLSSNLVVSASNPDGLVTKWASNLRLPIASCRKVNYFALRYINLIRLQK